MRPGKEDYSSGETAEDAGLTVDLLPTSQPSPPGSTRASDKKRRKKKPHALSMQMMPRLLEDRGMDPKLKPASPWAREMDFSDYAYTPHTALVLVLLLMSLLLMLQYYTEDKADIVANVKLGLFAACFIFIGFGAVHLPDSLMVRPHPAVWRTVLACGILYLLFLTFMLFQNLDTTRRIMESYDPALRHPLPDRAYAEDCRMSTPEQPWLFASTAFDVFILAHSIGYVAKTLILRDWRMVLVVSVGFEVVEVTFQHLLPNFRECWWDHVLLDIFLCNGGGMLLGLWLLHLLKAKQYQWTALREIPTVRGKARRVLSQFGPRSFQQFHWNIFESPKRFFQVLGITALMLLQELNCFTMKAILRMSPSHHLVTARLALWGFLAMPGMREYYEYMSNPRIRRIGTTAWVTTLGLIVETIWIAKMAVEGNYFVDASMPTHIAVPWMAAITLFVTWLVLFFAVLPPQQRREKRGMFYRAVNILFYGALLCILGLFLMGLPDLQIGRASFEQWMAPYESFILWWR